MLLAVDIGNTNIVFGLYVGRKLEQTFRVSTVRTRTEDEYGVMLQQLLALRKVPNDAIDAAIVASVVPPLTGRAGRCDSSCLRARAAGGGPGAEDGRARAL